MQKNSLRQRILRKEKWCHKMEKKLAVIVDNKEVTTEVVDTEMCSSACDVVMETCSSQSHDACGVCSSAVASVNEARVDYGAPSSDA